MACFARRRQGYLFARAAVYAFRYHPMEPTSGHLIGFFSMCLLLLQGSLFFTRVHVNCWWTFSREALVLVHGALVAVMQGNGLWPMFAFGFAGEVVDTQMHGVGFSRLGELAVLAVYAGGVAGGHQHVCPSAVRSSSTRRR